MENMPWSSSGRAKTILNGEMLEWASTMNELPTENTPSGRFWALIPCAGGGSRAATDGPKQYQHIAGCSVVEHTLRAFAGVARIGATAVVLAPGDSEFPLHLQTAHNKLWLAPCGGETRAQSVSNGIRWLVQQGATPLDWLLVHDAARCLITADQINRLIDSCASDSAGGLLAHRLADTLKQQQPESTPPRVAATVERKGKWLAQTPQMFRLGALLRALEAAGPDVTDEAGAMEAAGFEPLLVEGGALNFKLTYPEDFELAQAVLERRSRIFDNKGQA